MCCRLVILKSGLGLKSGLESIYAGLGLELELKRLGEFFLLQVFSSPLVI